MRPVAANRSFAWLVDETFRSMYPPSVGIDVIARHVVTCRGFFGSCSLRAGRAGFDAGGRAEPVIFDLIWQRKSEDGADRNRSKEHFAHAVPRTIFRQARVEITSIQAIAQLTSTFYAQN
jgi:hypothetical protein